MIQDPDDLTPIADASAPETPELRSARQARELKQMAAVGVWLVDNLQDRAQEPAATRPTPESLSLAYARITRAVRLTHALENRLWEQAQARPAEPRPRSPAEKRRHTLKTFLDRTAQERAEREAGFDMEATYERAERLIDEELEDEDIEGRPILEVYALICASLGLKPNWSLWDPRDWKDPTWGLTEQELSDDACPDGPPKRITDDWPEPGTLMPLPKSFSPREKDGPQAPEPAHAGEGPHGRMRDTGPKAIKPPP